MWNALASVPAVKTGRVHLLVGDAFVVPGPRIAVAADRFARALHPGCVLPMTYPTPDRLPDRGNDRDAVPARPGRSDCRCLRLHGSPARGAQEAEGLRVHQRAGSTRSRRSKPDLVLAFSDLQADLAAELVRRGIAVVTFNQRTVAEILQMIRMLGGLVGCQAEAEALADRLAADLDRIREAGARFPARWRVFFEEWDDPLISGIRWVEELVEIAGGARYFPNTRMPASPRIASSIPPW